MGTVWFCLMAVMLAGYVVLDGFDLGLGVLSLWIACDDTQRQDMLRSIGRVWSGNELWLLAAMGALYFAFPAAHAGSSSGFLAPVLIVLSLLAIRAILLKLRDRAGRAKGLRLWHGALALASLLLALSCGVLLGNIVRGLPLNGGGLFSEPLWTNFQPVGHTGILDWYTLLVGAVALAAVVLHGVAWLARNAAGDLRARAAQGLSALWWLVAALTTAVTIASFSLLPQLLESFRAHSWGIVFPAIAIAGLFGIKWFNHIGQETACFGSSCAYLIGMVGSIAFSLYPNVLPSSLNPFGSLTVAEFEAAGAGLRISLIWLAIGAGLACGYSIFARRVYFARNNASNIGSGKAEQREHLAASPR